MNLISTVSKVVVWIVPVLMIGIPIYGAIKKVKIYEAFIEGAMEGFKTVVKILPYYVAIFVSVALIRESGALNVITKLMGNLATKFGLSGEIVALGFMRPISGSASMGLASSIMQTYGADSFLGRLAATIQGSTDTTLFIIAVYFGSVGIHKVRHSLWGGLVADVAGFVASIIACKLIFG